MSLCNVFFKFYIQQDKRCHDNTVCLLFSAIQSHPESPPFDVVVFPPP